MRDAFVAAALCLLAAVASAQEPPRPHDRADALAWRRTHPIAATPRRVELTPELVTARGGAKEGGLFAQRGQTEAEHAESIKFDVALVATVYCRGAHREHMTLQRFARGYSPNVFEPGDDNPWIADLPWGDREPVAWPTGHRLWQPDDSRHCRVNPRTCRPDGITAWHRVRDLAVEALNGRLPHGCPVEPDDWGGHMDRDNGAEQGLVRMRCGRALNDGWIRPGLHAREEVVRACASVPEEQENCRSYLAPRAIPAALAAGRR